MHHDGFSFKNLFDIITYVELKVDLFISDDGCKEKECLRKEKIFLQRLYYEQSCPRNFLLTQEKPLISVAWSIHVITLMLFGPVPPIKT